MYDTQESQDTQQFEVPAVAVSHHQINPDAIIARPRSEEWLEERRNYLGSTDVSAILGLNPYVTPRLVYLDKKGLIPPKEMNQAMAHGLNLEEYVGKCYARTTGYKIRRSKLYRHKDFPYFAANPDYEVLSIRPRRLLECKTAGYFAGQVFGDLQDQVPDQYLIQCSWQMFVTGREFVDLATLIGGQDFRIYTIPRDEELIGMIAEQAYSWWNTYILSECPPPISGEKGDTEYLNSEYPQHYDNTLYAGPDLDDICLKLRDVSEQVSSLSKEQDRLKNSVKEYMKDSSKLEFSAGSITWKTNEKGVRVFKPNFSKSTSSAGKVVA